MTDEEETKLALLLGQVIGKQDAIHNDLTEFKEETHDSIEEVNVHLKDSNGRLSDVEHQIMTWKTRFITAFAILTFSLPLVVEQSRTFLIGIVT